MTTQPTWQPLSSVASASRRSAMLKRARVFFEERNILEVDTPILSRFAASDPHIESIEVTLQLDPDKSWFLQTSPEYCMKRLLSAGYPDIFEICKVFRDAEAGRYHQPEFTMVEWYRLDFGLNDIVQDTLEFITTLVDAKRFDKAPMLLSHAEAFAEFAGIDSSTADIETLSAAAAADDQLKQSLGDSRDDWLDLILAEKISSKFPTDRLTALCHYPASQAALSRICPDDASVADRFEVFAGDLELANGYVELVDAKEQSSRFEADQSARKLAGRPQRPIDRAFIAALASGLPACAGVAVGFDRVHMLNEGTGDIRQALSFAFERRNEND
ncbi:MAG: EF-P lysine aminoacylase EpmA [Proteobacteria bacterium]|nr:EF-P lysine aminoacylase EpmA [Pseudomonadota bacterium]